MKNLYLIRHAKSDWSDESKSDFDRGLNKRGEKAILTMANALKEKKAVPDLILSSSAKRAKLTAKGLAKELGYSKEILFLDVLYLCEPETWVEIIHSINDRYDSVFIVGHNPEITQLSNSLMDDYIDNVPTLGIVGFDVLVKKWGKFGRENIFKKFFIYPKLYKQ